MVPESIQTELTDVSGFRSRFSQVDKTKILKQGEKNILQNLGKSGLYEDAYKNAALFVEKFYQDLGFSKVEVYAQKSIL
jgi:hypothetical protein